MAQICKFDTRPATIVNGGYKKGKYIVWLNLSVSELSETENQSERFQSLTDRLVLSDNNVTSFLSVVDELHLAIATNDELLAILQYFQAENDIDSWKAVRQKQIIGYDQTDNVNRFYLNGLSLWLDKATRVGLVNSISAEQRDGSDVTTMWFENIEIQLPIEAALTALDKIELYAKTCYNVTAKHLADIKKIEDANELQQFDITADYPEFLQLNINE